LACPFKLKQKLKEEEVSFEKNVGEREKKSMGGDVGAHVGSD
jgi:hypothetical protein